MRVPGKEMPDHKTQRGACICCVESAALHNSSRILNRWSGEKYEHKRNQDRI